MAIDLIKKRYKFAGDIVKVLQEKAGWPKEDAAEVCNDIPDADVVEVVRCKDCQRVQHDKFFGCYFCYGNEVRPDHFCSYGVKKDDAV